MAIDGRRKTRVDPVKITPLVRLLRGFVWALAALASIVAFEAGSNYLFYLEHHKLFYAPDEIQQRNAAVAAHAAPGTTTPLHPYYGFVQEWSPEALQRSGLIANNYVWVQDQCHELTYAETCHALRNAYDANETKLKRAFKSDRPPLEEREAQLLAQLRNC